MKRDVKEREIGINQWEKEREVMRLSTNADTLTTINTRTFFFYSLHYFYAPICKNIRHYPRAKF